MKRAFCAATLAAFLLGIGIEPRTQAQDTTAKEDIKDAGKSTKRAAKKTASATKKTTKKAVHGSAKKVEEGAEKVKRKTSE